MRLYRFYRPLHLDRETLELSPFPRGGVCLLLEPINSSYFPSWSVCASNELFAKPVARTIAEQRLNGMIAAGIFDELGPLHALHYLKDTSTDSVVSAVLEWIENVVPHLEMESPKAYSLYLSQHLETVYERLMDIRRQNERLEAELLGHKVLRGEHAC